MSRFYYDLPLVAVDPDTVSRIYANPEIVEKFQKEYEYLMANPEQSYKLSREFTAMQMTVSQFKQLIEGWLRAEATLKVPIEDRPEELDEMFKSIMTHEQQTAVNIFDELIGEGYSKKFDSIIKAGHTDRLTWMDGMIWELSLDDCTLPKEKQDILIELKDIMYDACCVNGVPQCLVDVINNTPLSYIRKIYDSVVRLDRTIENIDFTMQKLKVYRLKASYIPIFFTGMAMSYKWKYVHSAIANNITVKPLEDSKPTKKNKKIAKKYANIDHAANKPHTPGILLGIILDKYIRSQPVVDYRVSWFVLMFIKNLSVNCLISSETKSFDTTLIPQADNLFKLMEMILDKYCIVEEVSDEVKSFDTQLREEQIPIVELPTKEEWNKYREDMAEREKRMFESSEEEGQRVPMRTDTYIEEATIEDIITSYPKIGNTSPTNILPPEVVEEKANQQSKDDDVGYEEDIIILPGSGDNIFHRDKD